MLSLNFSPFPTIRTSRLLLRQLTNADENEIFFLRFDDTVNKYVDRPKPDSLADARKHIERVNTGISNNESVFWGITLTGSPAIIGTICMWNISKTNYVAEVGFDLMPDFQGKNIMTEALSEVVRYAFETLKIRKLIGWVHQGNDKSRSLLGKFNFTRDAEEEEKADKDELKNMIIYSLQAADYFDKLRED